MIYGSHTLQILKARRKPIVIEANMHRIIMRNYVPAIEQRIQNIINRVLALDETEVSSLLNNIIIDFSHRHRYFREALARNYAEVSRFLPDNTEITEHRQLLIGSYFTAEYSVEAAALFNPSIVTVPSLEGDPKDTCRFIMSFRGVGEGHISSIEFRTGYVDRNKDIYFDAVSNYVRRPRTHTESVHERELFRLKLKDMGARSKACNWLINDLPEEFTADDLHQRISSCPSVCNIRAQDRKEITDMATWLADSNYVIAFNPEHQISERVIFPLSESESGGIEDARFVRFVEDHGEVVYYATYTAFNGKVTLPQMIKTRDFVRFTISTLYGKQAQGKGMALFPRKVNGHYAMLSRQGGECNSIMYSDNLHFWQKSRIIRGPELPHEFVQVGNCGSPIETPEGWLVITHGVGPMRTYSLGIDLLDLNDPSRLISRIEEPILVPNEYDREGYVPNVVYSCGSMIFKDELIIPYASADQRCGIATLSVPEVMAWLHYNKTKKEAS